MFEKPQDKQDWSPEAGLAPDTTIAGDNDDEGAAYSAFSKTAKRAIGYTASFAGMISGLSSFIYYPALEPLATDLGVSLQLVNVTITSYLVVAGIAPSIIGDMADFTGRRPVYVITFGLYFAANVGLALQHSYVALLVLRMVQSAGASATIAIAYGVISDIATPAERGSYVGILNGFTNSAPSFGPILGGILAQKTGWRWIFWLLSILSGLMFAGLLLFFPETCRRLAGDGSVPSTGINSTVPALIKGLGGETRRLERAKGPKHKLHIPNPLKIFPVLADRCSLLAILPGSFVYTVCGCLGASLSAQCIHIYDLSYLQAGLIYIPPGLGGIIAAYTTGRLLDHDYAVTAKRQGFTVNKRRGNDLSAFPIERARLRSIFYLMGVASFATVGYGWALQKKTHLAVPLVLQFLTGSSMVGVFTTISTLLTDLNPGRASTSQAAYNLVRCSLGAAGVAAMQALVDAVGLGFCFTIYGLLCALTVPLLAALHVKGLAWRQARRSEVKDTMSDQ